MEHAYINVSEHPAIKSRVVLISKSSGRFQGATADYVSQIMSTMTRDDAASVPIDIDRLITVLDKIAEINHVLDDVYALGSIHKKRKVIKSSKHF